MLLSDYRVAGSSVPVEDHLRSCVGWWMVSQFKNAIPYFDFGGCARSEGIRSCVSLVNVVRNWCFRLRLWICFHRDKGDGSGTIPRGWFVVCVHGIGSHVDVQWILMVLTPEFALLLLPLRLEFFLKISRYPSGVLAQQPPTRWRRFDSDARAARWFVIIDCIMCNFFLLMSV